jgi:hypothetical protein
MIQMSDQNVSGGDNSDAASGDQNKNQENKDSVKYETYSKVVGEAKRAREKLSETEKELEKLRAADKERQEADLKAKEDYKTLLANREAELAKEKTERMRLENEHRNARKLSAFLDSIEGKIDQKWWIHIDTDQIVLNPETGEIDQMSVTKAVDKFKADYGEIIQRPNGSRLPNDAPGGKSGKISYQEWINLPSKDMGKRKKDVDPTTIPD